MSPLGKFTLAIIGLRFAGAVGFFWGMFLGHILIDSTIVIKKIEKFIAQFDDNIRLLLPYHACRYYNKIDGYFGGKLGGAVLGSGLFGFYGFVTLFILGHFVFDTPRSRHASAFRAKFDALWQLHTYKILGAIVGFSLRSEALIFCGVIIGFFFDAWRHEKGFARKLGLGRLKTYWPKLRLLNLLPVSKSGRRKAFIKAMAGLAAKISKADGAVSPNEIHLFKQLFDIPQKANRSISKIFNRAKENVSGYERYAARIKQISGDDIALKEKVIENLFKIAVVDGEIGAQEREILRNIAEIIGLPRGNFKVIEEGFNPKRQGAGGNVRDFYEVLGVFCNASDSEIKKRWRELINEYHPDKVQARGATVSEIKAATEKMAEINNAYECILKLRNIA